MPSLDDFLQRKPLNDENAALMRGEEEAAIAPQPAVLTSESDELNEDDRDWLRRLMKEPGWPVFLRLTKRLVQQAERDAMLLSQNPEVSDGAKILQAWNWVRSLKMASSHVIQQAEFEANYKEEMQKA